MSWIISVSLALSVIIRVTSVIMDLALHSSELDATFFKKKDRFTHLFTGSFYLIVVLI